MTLPIQNQDALQCTYDQNPIPSVVEYENEPLVRSIYRDAEIGKSMEGIMNQVDRFCADILLALESDIANSELQQKQRLEHQRQQQHTQQGQIPSSKRKVDLADIEMLAGKKKARRSRLPQPAIAYLQKWFNDNLDNPYPSEDQKVEMAEHCGITQNQVVNWFTNTRKRVWLPHKKNQKKKAAAAAAAASAKRRPKQP